MTNNALVVSVNLDDRGLTDNGKEYFRHVINDYSNELLNRAKSNGDASTIRGAQIEITQEHVRNASTSIARSFGSPAKPWWVMPAQIIERLCMVVVGYGTGNLDKPNGIFAFGAGLFIAVVIFVVTYQKAKGD